MRVVGEYADKKNSAYRIPKGGYVALDVQSAYVDTYTGKSVEECEKCFIKLYSGHFSFEILTKDGEYFSPEKANSFIKAMVLKDVFELDSHDLALYYAVDLRPNYINISNEIDEDLDPIPLEVFVVNK